MDNIWKKMSQSTINDDDISSTYELVSKNFSEKFSLPLTTILEVKELDKELQSNDDYRKYLFKEYSKIGGTDGRQRGEKVAVNLAEIFFTKSVLVNFPWTGISRTAGVEKKPFQCYDALIDLFYLLVSASDSRWTKEENVCFFRDKILKHANARIKAHNSKLNKKLTQAEIHSDAISETTEEIEDDTPTVNCTDKND